MVKRKNKLEGTYPYGLDNKAESKETKAEFMDPEESASTLVARTARSRPSPGSLELEEKKGLPSVRFTKRKKKAYA